MEFRILGPLEVLDGNGPVALGRLKERMVLAVLLLHANDYVSRERLIDELWGQAPPPTARSAVNVHLSQLRKTLTRHGDDPIETAAGGYRLVVDPNQLDATRVQQMLAGARERASQGELEAAARLYREAVLLWRGPTLAGLVLESDGRNEVEQLDELRLAATMDRVDCDLALGRHEKVIGELQLLVSQHPLRERLRAQQMLALYRAHRQAEALDAYQQARRVLVEELGIDPNPALQRLQQGILRHDPSLEAPAGISIVPVEDEDARGRFLGESQIVASVEQLSSIPTLEGVGEEAGEDAASGYGVAGGDVAADSTARPPGVRLWRGRDARRHGIGAVVAVLAAAVAVAFFLVPRHGSGGISSVAPNSVGVIDPRSNEVVAEVSVGSRPGPVAIGEGAVWAANLDDDTVSRIDPRTRNVMKTIPVGGFPGDIAVAPGSIWVFLPQHDALTAITPEFDDTHVTALKRLPSSPFCDPLHAALAVQGEWGWILCGEGQLYRVNLRTGGVAQPSFDTGGSFVPTDYSDVAAGRGSAWVVTRSGNTMTEIDTTTNKADVPNAITVGRAPAAISDGLGSLWVANHDDNTVTRIEYPHFGGTPTLHTIPVGKGPNDVAVGEGAAWVVNSLDGTVSRIDPKTNKVVTTIEVAKGLQRIAAGEGDVWVTVQSAPMS